MGVVWLNQRTIISRRCPNINCGFEVTQYEVEHTGRDLRCPKCQRYTLSQFIPSRYSDESKGR